MSKMNRARVDENGIDLAFREIKIALSDFPIGRDEVADLRWVLFGAGQGAEKSLATTRQALRRYRELHQAFRNNHEGLPAGPGHLAGGHRSAIQAMI